MSAARSASALGLAAATAASLSACQTTQQTSARAKLSADRVLATQHPLRVVRLNPAVQVVRVSLLRSAGGAAIVVALHNRTRRSVADLPISVGVRTRGAQQYLNRASGLDYFQTHVPALAAGGDATWVFQTAASLRPYGTPFAAVGVPNADATPSVRRLPPIEVRLAAPAGPGLGRATVFNRSDIDQRGLPVYAVAVRRGCYTAGGSGSIAELAPGARATVDVKLTGDSRDAAVHLEAPPAFLR
jgi:hypothetical protein